MHQLKPFSKILVLTALIFIVLLEVSCSDGRGLVEEMIEALSTKSTKETTLLPGVYLRDNYTWMTRIKDHHLVLYETQLMRADRPMAKENVKKACIAKKKKNVDHKDLLYGPIKWRDLRRCTN